MQSADFLSAVFFYLKEGENLNQNWIVENLNNAFSTWNGKLGELWGLVTTGPQTFKGGAVWSVMQTLHNGMVGIGYALVVLFFAISLCKNTMNFHELKRPEAAIHYFLRFVAAKALVGYGMDIMLNVFSICNGIVTDMADSMGGISEAMVSLPAEMQTAIENVGFLASIPLWLVTILGSLFIAPHRECAHDADEIADSTCTVQYPRNSHTGRHLLRQKRRDRQSHHRAAH